MVWRLKIRVTCLLLAKCLPLQLFHFRQKGFFVFLQDQAGNPVDHGGPVRVTVEHESDDSLPNSNNPTLHTFLPSERTVVVADVHRDTVFNLFNLKEQADGTARYVY